jgi:hypothetical protein
LKANLLKEKQKTEEKKALEEAVDNIPEPDNKYKNNVGGSKIPEMCEYIVIPDIVIFLFVGLNNYVVTSHISCRHIHQQQFMYKIFRFLSVKFKLSTIFFKFDRFA